LLICILGSRSFSSINLFKKLFLLEAMLDIHLKDLKTDSHLGILEFFLRIDGVSGENKAFSPTVRTFFKSLPGLKLIF
jgi:hypothetical protein